MGVYRACDTVVAGNKAKWLVDNEFLARLPSPLAKILRHVVFDEQHGRWHLAFFDQCIVRSVFQPIVSFALGKVVGHEALLRAATSADTPVPTELFFNLAQTHRLFEYIDRALRILHVANFCDAEGWLFLNYHPQLFGNKKHHEISKTIVSAAQEIYQLNPRRIVLEIVENKATEADLKHDIELLHQMGFRVAIDDFGSGASNFERVLNVAPEIVKIDRGVTQRCLYDPKAVVFLKQLVEMLHSAGSLVLLEGIENEAQALLAIEANVDFGQGWFFALPGLSPVSDQFKFRPQIAALVKQCSAKLAQDKKHTQSLLAHYARSILAVSAQLEIGASFSQLADTLIDLPHCLRAYVLDETGRLASDHASSFCCERDASTEPNEIGKYEQRAFARELLEQANFVIPPVFLHHVLGAGVGVERSEPYLSSGDGRQVVAIAKRFERNGVTHILSCEIDPHVFA